MPKDQACKGTAITQVQGTDLNVLSILKTIVFTTNFFTAKEVFFLGENVLTIRY